MGVDEPAEGAPLGPVGMLVDPPGVVGEGDRPDICREGVWLQPPRPAREGYPRCATNPRGPEGGLVGLGASERCGPAPGVCGCLELDGNGEDTELDKVRPAEGPVGGARNAAGPRGGDLDADGGSHGPDRGVSLTEPEPEPTVRWGDCSRDCNGDRALVEPGCGDALSEGG